MIIYMKKYGGGTCRWACGQAVGLRATPAGNLTGCTTLLYRTYDLLQAESSRINQLNQYSKGGWREQVDFGRFAVAGAGAGDSKNGL